MYPLIWLQQLLKRPEYFSKFGKVIKIVVNNSTNYAGPQVCGCTIHVYLFSPIVGGQTK